MNLIASACASNNIDLDWVGPLLLSAGEVARVPTGIPGIYILHTFDPGRGLYPAFYVGKSADLRSRLTQHLGVASTSPDIFVVRRNIRSYFSATPVVGMVERAAVEAALINLLRPPCNRQVPRMPSLYPNLPPFTLRF